jgi:hypothetical protein
MCRGWHCSSKIAIPPSLCHLVTCKPCYCAPICSIADRTWPAAALVLPLLWRAGELSTSFSLLCLGPGSCCGRRGAPELRRPCTSGDRCTCDSQPHILSAGVGLIPMYYHGRFSWPKAVAGEQIANEWCSRWQMTFVERTSECSLGHCRMCTVGLAAGSNREPGTALLAAMTASQHTWWYAACTGEPDCSSAVSDLDAASSSAQW